MNKVTFKNIFDKRHTYGTPTIAFGGIGGDGRFTMHLAHDHAEVPANIEVTMNDDGTMTPEKTEEQIVHRTIMHTSQFDPLFATRLGKWLIENSLPRIPDDERTRIQEEMDELFKGTPTDKKDLHYVG